MKKTLSALAVAAVLATPVFAFQGAAKSAATAAASSWTGYITDTHCGKNGATKDHSAACVEKCMKGGSKAQLYSDADGKLYDLDSFDKVKTMVGKKVTIKGTLDASTNTISVQSAEKAAS